MPRYDNVVRDRTPEIIEANGQHPVVAHLASQTPEFRIVHE